MTETNTDKQPSIILTIDTTSPRASMAISAGQKVLAQIGIVGNERRSTNLLTEIDWLLARLGLTIADIAAFGVLVGPGSFTGLRVGLATIKGFAHALSRPVIAMKTTEVVARACGISDCTCVMLDAHRGEAFVQLFANNDDEIPRELSEIVVAKVEKFLPVIYEYQLSNNLPGIIFAGDAVELYKEKLLEFTNANSIPTQKAKLLTTQAVGWILNKPIDFLATEATLYAQEKYSKGEVLSAEDLAAYYVRPAEAEVKLQLGLIGKKKTNLS